MLCYKWLRPQQYYFVPIVTYELHALVVFCKSLTLPHYPLSEKSLQSEIFMYHIIMNSAFVERRRRSRLGNG